ncbi:MAG TPA: MFS transporter [Candidatus Paceibacterota bacterium]|jgi:MFS family permease|nr:MFS transporter [Candidatus Paceibacterota bacterium]
MSTHKQSLIPVYAANLFLSLHYAVLLYINSSYLGTFVSEKTLSFLYIAAAILNIAIFTNAARILQKISLRKLLFTVAFTDLAATASLSFMSGKIIVPTLFVLLSSCSLATLFCLDIFLESRSEDKRTGRIRSGYLTLMNFAVLVSPFFSGVIVGPDSYWRAYAVSAIFLAVMIAIAAAYLTDDVHPSRKLGKTFETIGLFLRDSAIRKIFTANFLLQFFYAWMVVYVPIYLHEYLAFDWKTIGVIFTVMLVPFVLFEMPVGRLADTVTGEKEFLIAGFVIMIAFTALIPFVPQWQLLLWAFVLFMTRVGASFVEVTTESYFWKHVNARQSGFIGIFRLAEPLAYVLGPLVAIIALSLIPFQYIFLILALILLLGLGVSFALQDTR